MPHQPTVTPSPQTPTANLTASVGDDIVAGQPLAAVDAHVGITRQLAAEWIERGKCRESQAFETFLIRHCLACESRFYTVAAEMLQVADSPVIDLAIKLRRLEVLKRKIEDLEPLRCFEIV